MSEQAIARPIRYSATAVSIIKRRLSRLCRGRRLNVLRDDFPTAERDKLDGVSLCDCSRRLSVNSTPGRGRRHLPKKATSKT